jgi:hypothetical protein
VRLSLATHLGTSGVLVCTTRSSSYNGVKCTVQHSSKTQKVRGVSTTAYYFSTPVLLYMVVPVEKNYKVPGEHAVLQVPWHLDSVATDRAHVPIAKPQQN